MNHNSKFTENVALLDRLVPLSRSANTYNGSWIDTKNFFQFAALLQIGDVGSGGTVNFKLQEASTSGGAGAADITGKAITQVAQTGSPATGGDNREFFINLRSDELTDGFRYIRIVAITATAATVCSAALFGFSARSEPASDFDAATVQEIV